MREAIPCTITLKPDKSIDYTISAYCDGKLFDVKTVEAQKYEETTVYGEYTLPINGYVDFQIIVQRGDGSVSAEYQKNIHSLPPVKESIFLPVTRGLGLAGALKVSERNDVAQFTAHRLEFNWPNSERTKGEYNIGHEDNIAAAIESDTSIVALINQNNSLYGDTRTHAGGLLEIPTSKASLDGFSDFVTQIQTKYAENSPIEYFEIYNEPNCFYFYGKDESYTYMAQLSRLKLKQNNPDEKTAVGVIAEGDASYLKRLMQSGIYPHMDAVSNHPYIRPDLVDERYATELSEMTGVVTKYGGWKEQIITEIGWPTHTTGITKEQQAIESAKQAIVADYFDIGINEYYKSSDEITSASYSIDESEHNFGIFYQKDGTLKPAAYSVSAMNYETAGAIFCGKLPFENENIEAYLYARDGEIKCVIWTKGEAATVSFEGEILTAYDMNGNYIGEGESFEIGEKPVYLHGLSKKHIINSLGENIKTYLDLYMPLAFAESEGKTGFDAAKALLYEAVENAESFTAEYTAADEAKALDALCEHYAIGNKLIAMYKNGDLEITEAQLSGLLYLNHWGGVLWSVVYMMDSDNGEAVISSDDEYTNAKTYIDTLKGENTLRYSESILVYAEKYADKAEKLNAAAEAADLKIGAVKAWDKLAVILAELAVSMADVETVGYDNVLVQLPFSERTIPTGENVLLNVSVYNFRPTKKLSGYAELLDPDGNVVATSLTFGVSAGGGAAVKMPVTLSEIKSGNYTLRLISEGKELARHTITKLFKG